MNPYHLGRAVFFLIFLAVITPEIRAAYVNGIVQNGNNGDQVTLVIPHYYIDGKDSHIKTRLNNAGQFYVTAPISTPQLVYLYYNESRLPLFLAPDDTLTIRTDLFQFPLTVTLAGKASANNRLLRTYLDENPEDYNEFNNLRFKIGQYWTHVEEPMNAQMESLAPADFKAAMDTRKTSAFLLLDEFIKKYPESVSPEFSEWLSNEIIYHWAYHLLVYGQVYGNRHFIDPSFFEFLYEAPIISETLTSHWYRQFLMILMAREQYKKDPESNFFQGQYYLANTLLTGKPLAFFRSEIIYQAFSGDRYKEILPLYINFLQTNPYAEFDPKVEDLYQRIARVSAGAEAPRFAAVDESGKEVRLIQYRGKVIYLNFWASWCGACLRKMELFNEFKDEITGKDIEIINVSIDENPENWRKAIELGQFIGTHILASSGLDKNLALLYNVEAVPKYFIINKNGNFADKATSSQPNDILFKLVELANVNSK